MENLQYDKRKCHLHKLGSFNIFHGNVDRITYLYTKIQFNCYLYLLQPYTQKGYITHTNSSHRYIHLWPLQNCLVTPCKKFVLQKHRIKKKTNNTIKQIFSKTYNNI